MWKIFNQTPICIDFYQVALGIDGWIILWTIVICKCAYYFTSCPPSAHLVAPILRLLMMFLWNIFLDWYLTHWSLFFSEMPRNYCQDVTPATTWASTWWCWQLVFLCRIQTGVGLKSGCYTERIVQQGDRDASDVQRQGKMTRMKPRLRLSLVRRIDLG